MDMTRVPPAPVRFDPERLFAGVYWYQRWQIFRGYYTPGHNSIDKLCNTVQLPRDLTGQRVLDIGAWNGCLSFECERRGAREVVALGPESPESTGFLRLAAVLGSQRTHYQLGTIYDLDPEKLGHFDVVLCCGVLHHLRYPLLGLDNIRRVCTGTLYLETLISDERLAAHCSPAARAAPLWEFFRRNEINNDDSTWFGPTSVAVVQALESAGFGVLEPQKNQKGGRGAFQAQVKPGVPEFLAIQCAEAVYYETLVRHLFGPKRIGSEPTPVRVQPAA